MPQVRYGPDITDDAARIMNDIVDLQKLRKQKGKLSQRQATYYKNQKNIAKRLFGLTDKDIEKGNFKLMKDLAQYGFGGRDKRGRAYRKGKYARNKRDKTLRRRTVARESEIASLGKTKRTYTEDEAPAGGATYIGRTVPKKLASHLQKFDRIQKRKGRASYQGRRVNKIRPYALGGKEDINKLMGSVPKPKKPKPSTAKKPTKPKKPPRPKRPSEFIPNAMQRRSNLRPRAISGRATSASSKRTKAQNRKRKNVVKRAGRGRNKRAGRGRKR